jgi:hypothetical protein
VVVVLLAGAHVSAAPQQERKPSRSPEAAMEAIHARHEARHQALLAGESSQQAIRQNFEVVRRVRLGGASADADVFYFNHGPRVGRFAYVGTWSRPCSGRGVKIVDVTRPRRARLVAVTPTPPSQLGGVSYEDMAVARIGNRVVLATGVQACAEFGRGGLALFDVTNPRRPRRLSFLPMPAGGVHELDLARRPNGQVLALLAVPFVEFFNTYLGTDLGGEVRIVDITRPRRPRPLSTWGIIANSSLHPFRRDRPVASSFEGLGYFAAHYAHSVRAANRGRVAYASYWDGGVVKLDIRDPEKPMPVGRTSYPSDVDGDAHSLAVYNAGGERYLLQNDEDFTPLSPAIVTTSATGEERFQGIEEPWMPTLLSDVGEMQGAIHDAGEGCESNDFAGAAGKIVLADTRDPTYFNVLPGWPLPACNIGVPILHAAGGGATAVVLNLISPDDAYPYPPSPARLQNIRAQATDLPVVQISDLDGLAERIRAAQGPPVTVTLTPSEPSWGYLRVFQESQMSEGPSGVPEFQQVGEFNDLPHVTGELDPPEGTWSIHNTEVKGNRAYSSWYAHGVVALDLSDPTNPRKVGQFARPTAGRPRVFGDEAYPQVWGVAVDRARNLVYASDMRAGLWILRPVRAARPR